MQTKLNCLALMKHKQSCQARHCYYEIKIFVYSNPEKKNNKCLFLFMKYKEEDGNKVWNVAKQKPKEQKCEGSRDLVTHSGTLTRALSILGSRGAIGRWKLRERLVSSHRRCNLRVPLHPRHKALPWSEVQGRGSEIGNATKGEARCHYDWPLCQAWTRAATG